MMSVKEKNQLRNLLEYLEHQPLTEDYQRPFSHQIKRKHRIDVSHRLRDEQGRFLPSNYPIIEEYDWTLDKDIEAPRKLKIEPVKDSYGSYTVNEKDKRDLVGTIYLVSFFGILLISYLC